MIDPPQQPANFCAIARAILAPGVSVAVVLGMAATFISEHYGAPAMLMALLLGIAFHFLAEEGKCVEGIDFAARTILRIGVALLGVRISLDLLVGLGPALIALVVCAVIATIAFGTVAARFLGRSTRFGLLTGGSVAICGASAAMAIAAVLPRNEKRREGPDLHRARRHGDGHAGDDLLPDARRRPRPRHPHHRPLPRRHHPRCRPGGRCRLLGLRGYRRDRDARQAHPRLDARARSYSCSRWSTATAATARARR